MAEIRCHSCGKTNPANSEFCSFCQAVLGSTAVGNVQEPSLNSEYHPTNETLPDPVETNQVSQGRDPSMEGKNPLAGLDNALPLEPTVRDLTKPVVYPVQSSETDIQKAYTLLLSQMVKDETKRPTYTRSAPKKSQSILRIVVAGILFFTILVPILWNKPAAQLPSLSTELILFDQKISELSPGATVLYSVDYDPSATAEMEAASWAVINQLMARDIQLVLVSTTPTGPVQAARLVQNIISTQQNQVGSPLPASQIINLGLIPGGSAGLASFSENPSFFLKDATEMQMGENPASEQTQPVLDLTSISNLAMVVVVTDTPETARNWIEQVQPWLGGKPLMMILSAQAEPLIQSYYEGGIRQVEGVVISVAGGAGYEELVGIKGPALEMWSAFVNASWIAGTLIILAGMIHLVYTQMVQEKQGSGEKTS